MKKLLSITGLIFGMVILLHTGAFAQYALKLGDQQYDQFNYSKAADYYQQAYDKKESEHAAERLADCYRLMHDYAQAENWYAKVINMPGSTPENVLKYAGVLRSNSKFAEAKAQYIKYASQKKVSEGQLQVWTASCDSAIYWMQNPTSVTIKNEKILNSGKSDYGAVPYNNTTVFSSDRPVEMPKKTMKDKPFLKFSEGKGIDKTTYGWTGNSYLRLFQSNGKDTAKLFPIVAGTDYHIGSATFNEAGDEIFFTLTRLVGGNIKMGVSKYNTIHIEIYSAKLDPKTGKWGAPKPFKYNDADNYSVGDPYLTPDGKTLYFVSTMPGGKGGTDIYYCTRDDKGNWSKPVNVAALNTAGNERTPVLDKDNNFYFSSDGLVGIGGLDIYKSTKSDDNNFSAPMNMGSPLNTTRDDFAYIKTSPTTGYFTSDRPGGSGSDDIYSFVEMLVIKLRLEGIVYDKSTQEPIPNALVNLTKAGGGDMSISTDGKGAYAFDLAENSDYSVKGSKDNYSKDSVNFTTVNIKVSTTIKKDLYINKSATTAMAGTNPNHISFESNKPSSSGHMPNSPEVNGKLNLGPPRYAVAANVPFAIHNIYYGFDKDNITPAAAAELDHIVSVMNDHPEISIELGSHTDSRGSDVYNLDLSQRRAQAAVNYIISKGIDKSRLTAQGYGETQLVNKCADGVSCTPGQHARNRRTEFKVTGKK